MTLVAALGRIDDIQQRIRTLSADAAPAAAAETAATASTQSTTASAFASAVRDAGAVGEVPTLPAGPVDGGDIVAQAKNYLGVPYVFGGEDRSGMDCSGLVQRVLADLGIDAPRVVQDQADIGVEVPSLADAQPGDLIVTKGEGHIVIYAGDGMVIHAPSPGKHVELRNNWLKDGDIATIRRVVPPPGEAVATVAGTGGASFTAGAVASSGASAVASALASLASAAPGAPLSAAALVGQPSAARTALSALSSMASSGAAVGADTAPTAPLLAAAVAPTAGTATPVAAAPQTAAAPASAPPALAPQLTAPISSLVRSGDGQHTLTLRVSPEDLGPVTVKAHISGSSVTVELASGTAAGRDALRALLVDLRRDLAGLVPHASIAITTADAARGDQSATAGGSSGGSAGGALAGGGAGGSGGSASGQPFDQSTAGRSSRDGGAAHDTAAAVRVDAPTPTPAPSATTAAGGIDLFA